MVLCQYFCYSAPQTAINLVVFCAHENPAFFGEGDYRLGIYGLYCMHIYDSRIDIFLLQLFSRLEGLVDLETAGEYRDVLPVPINICFADFEWGVSRGEYGYILA